MQKLILAYNFTGERLQALRLICMMLKVQLKPVAREDMLQPIGYLAGLKEFTPVNEKFSGEEATEELLVLAGFDRPLLDKLLQAIAKSKLKKVELKAMLTTHNIVWNGKELLQEIAEEHEYMTRYGRPKPDEHEEIRKEKEENN